MPPPDVAVARRDSDLAGCESRLASTGNVRGDGDAAAATPIRVTKRQGRAALKVNRNADEAEGTNALL